MFYILNQLIVVYLVLNCRSTSQSTIVKRSVPNIIRNIFDDKNEYNDWDDSDFWRGGRETKKVQEQPFLQAESDAGRNPEDLGRRKSVEEPNVKDYDGDDDYYSEYENPNLQQPQRRSPDVPIKRGDVNEDCSTNGPVKETATEEAEEINKEGIGDEVSSQSVTEGVGSSNDYDTASEEGTPLPTEAPTEAVVAATEADIKGIKQWDAWTEWTECSASCGTGKSVRWRHCLGGPCQLGDKEAQVKVCNTDPCPQDPPATENCVAMYGHSRCW